MSDPMPSELKAAKEEADAAAAGLRAIEAMTDAALGYRNLDDSLRELLFRTCAVLAADAAAILLLTKDGQSLTLRASHGLGAEAQEEVGVALGRGIVAQIAARREPLI